MASKEFPIVGDSLVLGYRFQRHWEDFMARAFFFGELGAGVFLAGALYGSVTAMLAGVAITVVLKSYFHLAHMGVPSRAWRAIIRPDRSWISRGLISIVGFAAFGLLHIAVVAYAPIEGALALAIKAAAIVLALIVMTYHGFAIADSTSIAFWNTGLMPISSLCYSALGGVSVLAMVQPGDAGAGSLPPVELAVQFMLIVTLIVVLALMQGARRGPPGARKSLNLLTSEGPWVKWFLGVVLTGGLLLPLLLTFAPPSLPLSVVTAVLVLAGFYTFRVLVFKVGLYDPPISFAPEG